MGGGGGRWAKEERGNKEIYERRVEMARVVGVFWKRIDEGLQSV